MTTIKELETAIFQLENDLYSQRKNFEKECDVLINDDDTYYYFDYRRLTDLDVEEMEQFYVSIVRTRKELNDLQELKYQLEHQTKMIEILLQLKTLIEVKLFQKTDVLNDDVNTLIIGYLTGISKKNIEDQLKLF